jgi:hypothetical protein
MAVISSMHGLSKVAHRLTSSLDKLIGSHSAYHREMELSEERLKNLRGELQGIGDDSEQVSHRLLGQGGRLKAASAEAIAGLFGVQKGLTYVLRPLSEFGLKQLDLARMTARGTALMAGSASDWEKSQTAIVRGAVELRKEIGASPEEAAQLATIVGAGYKMADELFPSEKFDMTRKAAKDYLVELGSTAKLTGVSATEMASFNNAMMMNLRLGEKERTNIVGMIRGVGKFGVTGTEAIQTIQDNYDKIIAMSKDDRTRFTESLLQSAGLFKRAGVDFTKATERWQGRGADRFMEGAMIQAFGGGKLHEYMAAKIGAELGNPEDRVRQLEMQAKALEGEMTAITGLTADAVEKGLADIQAGGDRRKSQQAQQVIAKTPLLEIVNKDSLEKFGQTFTEILKAREEAKKLQEELLRGKFSVQDAKKILEPVLTTQENTERLLSTFVDSIHGFSVDFAKGVSSFKAAVDAFDQGASHLEVGLLGVLAGWEGLKGIFGGFKSGGGLMGELIGNIGKAGVGKVLAGSFTEGVAEAGLGTTLATSFVGVVGAAGLGYLIGHEFYKAYSGTIDKTDDTFNQRNGELRNDAGKRKEAEDALRGYRDYKNEHWFKTFMLGTSDKNFKKHVDAVESAGFGREPDFGAGGSSRIDNQIQNFEAMDRYDQKPKIQAHALGSWDILDDHVAQIHKGEMVVPQPYAENIRNIIDVTKDYDEEEFNTDWDSPIAASAPSDTKVDVLDALKEVARLRPVLDRILAAIENNGDAVLFGEGVSHNSHTDFAM